MFDLCVKVKGGWQTVATWAGCSPVCLRKAERIFESHGFDLRSAEVRWTKQVRSQKNWRGLSNNCRQLS